MNIISEIIENNKIVSRYKSSKISNITINGKDFKFAKSTQVVGKNIIFCEDAVDENIIKMRINGTSLGIGDLSDNILPLNYKSNSSNGVEMIVNEDGSITSYGTPTGYVAIELYSGELFSSESGAITISLSGDCVNSNIIVNIQDESKNSLTQMTVNKETPRTIKYSNYPDAKFISIAYRREKNNIPMSGTGYIMVVEGDKEKDFVPNGKYYIPINQHGKNLADYTKAKPRNSNQKITIDEENESVIWTGDYYFEIPIDIKAGRTLKLSYESDYAGNWTIGFEDGTFTGNIGLKDYKKIDKNATLLRIYKYSAQTSGTEMVFKRIMLEYGQVESIYEKYIEPKKYYEIINYPIPLGEYVDFKNINLFRGNNIFEINTKNTPEEILVNYWKQI